MKILEAMRSMISDLAEVEAQWGLTVVVKKSENGFGIRFEHPGRNAYCPVELDIDVRGGIPVGGSAWDRVDVYFDYVGEYTIGNNAWKGLVVERSDYFELEGDRQDRIEAVLSTIENTGLLPHEDKVPDGVSLDEDFVRLYADLAEATSDVANIAINCAREGGNESYSFTDEAGRAFKIELQAGRAKLFVSGRMIAETTAHAREELCAIVRQQIQMSANPTLTKVGPLTR